MQQNPSILSHVSLGTNDLAQAIAFYDAVLAPLGINRIMQVPTGQAYGRAHPEFWIQTPYDGRLAETANGTHISFFAHSKTEVDAFYKAAIAHGASCDGAPGPRPVYGPPYYGCFVRDLDGHKIEATFWDEQLAQHQ